MKKWINIIGMIVGAGLFIMGPLGSNFLVWPKSVGIAICTAGGGLFGLAMALHVVKMLARDRAISRELNDERTILIRQRAAYTTNWINLIFLAAATVLFIGMENYVPAGVTGAIFIMNTIVYTMVISRLEKLL